MSKSISIIANTLLTLVVVPVMYELLYFKKSRMERSLAMFYEMIVG